MITQEELKSKLLDKYGKGVTKEEVKPEPKGKVTPESLFNKSVKIDKLNMLSYEDIYML